MQPNQRTLTHARTYGESRTQDEALFESLFLQHYGLVHRVLLRLLGDEAEAEDISQRVFLKLYHSMERLLAQADEANIAGWLYRVAVNEGYNALRGRRRRTSWHEKLARWWPLTHSPPDPAQLAERRDTQTQVRQILTDMKPRDAQLLLLRHAGLSYKELAVALEITPGSVGPLLTQAKRTFAEKYRVAFVEKE